MTREKSCFILYRSLLEVPSSYTKPGYLGFKSRRTWKYFEPQTFETGGYHRHSILTSQPVAPGLIPSIPKNVLYNLLMSLGFIDATAYSKVDRALKMSLEPI